MTAPPKTIMKSVNRSKDDLVSKSNVKMPTLKTYKFRVSMWCEGCALDVKQALETSKGPRTVVDYSIDYNTKRVTIISPLPYDEVFKIITKAGKDATFEETGRPVSK